jgi:hypothetical protein
MDIEDCREKSCQHATLVTITSTNPLELLRELGECGNLPMPVRVLVTGLDSSLHFSTPGEVQSYREGLLDAAQVFK